MAVEPDESQLAAIAESAGGPGDGPVVMLNLNRYRDRDAYNRYGVVALGVLERVGGRVLWDLPVAGTVIGGEDERYDDVIAVWYPNRSAFLALAGDPEIQAARADRASGLERATLICCDASALPES